MPVIVLYIIYGILYLAIIKSLKMASGCLKLGVLYLWVILLYKARNDQIYYYIRILKKCFKMDFLRFKVLYFVFYMVE